jgi:ABC-2 type transport system permease protein
MSRQLSHPRYETALEVQRRIVNRYRFLSPAVVMQEALNDLAGTSFSRHQHFVSQVEQYHREWQGFFIPKIFKRVKLVSEDYDAFPKFVFSEEPFRTIVMRIALGYIGVAAPATVLLYLAWRTLRSARFSV